MSAARPRVLACKRCGSEFWSTVRSARYCSEICGFLYYVGPPDEVGCRHWQGSIDRDGYGSAGRARAHRKAWELAFGPIPKGLVVMHACDAPSCVESSHLMIGTQLANVRDRNQKQRQARGDKVGGARFTEQDVLKIRSDIAAGVARIELAAAHNVDRSYIDKIANGYVWRHLLTPKTLPGSTSND